MFRILCFGLVVVSCSCSKALRWEEISFDLVVRELEESYGIKVDANAPDLVEVRAAQQVISSGEFIVARIDSSQQFVREIEGQLDQKLGYRPPLATSGFGRRRVSWLPDGDQVLSRSYRFSPFPDQQFGKGTILLEVHTLSEPNAILISLTPKDRYQSIYNRLPGG